MPTELQIIDGFERMREAFLRDNPAFVREDERLPPATPEQAVARAWLRANDGKLDGSPGQQRRLRGLTRALLDGDGDGSSALSALSEEDAKLVAGAGDFRNLIDKARERSLAPLAANPSPRAATEEAKAWPEILPGLNGLKAWRFLEYLGRPALAPTSPLRRTLWRLGSIEIEPGPAAIPASHAALELISGLTGIALPMLGALLRWHAAAQPGLQGGGWCSARPRCGDCPLRPACAWARFHPGEGEARPQAGRELEAAARRQLVEGRLDQLEELELLALSLPQRNGRQTARETAEDLLRLFGGLRGLERASVAELAAAPGLTQKQAVTLKASLELGRRLAERALQPGDPIRGSEDVWQAYRLRFRNLPQEHFVIVLLDTKNRVIHDHIVSKGTLSQSLAHPREVFQHAVRQSAASIILMHNHPSGDPTPSREDIDVTRRLRQAGEILGIQVLDHVILGADGYYSFKDEE